MALASTPRRSSLATRWASSRASVRRRAASPRPSVWLLPNWVCFCPLLDPARADGRGRLSPAQKSTSASISFEPRDAARRSFASGPPIRQRCEKCGKRPSLVCGPVASRICCWGRAYYRAPSWFRATLRNRSRPHLGPRTSPNSGALRAQRCARRASNGVATQVGAT